MQSMEEKWLDIEEFKGLYQVSNLGRVRSVERHINTRTYPSVIMKQYPHSNGKTVAGMRVHLRNPKRAGQIQRSVGKLVLITFQGNPPKLAKQVIHKDGDATNNALSNLAWDVNKAHFATINEKARRLFHEKAYGIVKGICLKCYDIYNPWLYGMYDTDDLIQDCLIAIWEIIDIYDETHCGFYTFCRIKVEFVFKRLYNKWKRRNSICRFTLSNDMEAVENEIIRKEYGICSKHKKKD